MQIDTQSTLRDIFDIKDVYISMLEAHDAAVADETMTDAEKEGVLATIWKHIEAIGPEFDAVVLQAADVIRMLEIKREAAKKEKKRFADLESNLQEKEDRLREYIKRSMINANRPKVSGDQGTVSVGKGRDKIQVDDLDLVPKEFLKIEVTPRLQEIGKFLASGKPCSWARKVPNPEQVLRIS